MHTRMFPNSSFCCQLPLARTVQLRPDHLLLWTPRGNDPQIMHAPVPSVPLRSGRISLSPGRGQQSCLISGPGGRTVGGWPGLAGWGELRSGSLAGPSAICDTALLSSPSPLRLGVHRSGDPWELEANFPPSLVMGRPQVLPLIKVKRGA